MAYFVDPSPAVGRPGEVHTSQLNDLGAVRKYSDGSEYIYLAGVSGCAAGHVVVYRPAAFVAILVATGLKGSLAVATAAVTAATSYGWFMIVGQYTTVSTLGSAIASNVPLFIGGVAGQIDDTVVKGDQIFGAFVRNAAAGSAILHVNRAFVGASNESAA
jgi:hypothetical protein